MQRSKEDLVDIIEQMIDLYPDLQDIIERPTPEMGIEFLRRVDGSHN